SAPASSLAAPSAASASAAAASVGTAVSARTSGGVPVAAASGLGVVLSTDMGTLWEALLYLGLVAMPTPQRLKMRHPGYQRWTSFTQTESFRPLHAAISA